jgi:hypothetical protein
MKLLLTSTLILALNCLIAQNTQILPFTGIQYHENGISGKEIEVELDDNTWTSNQLPIESSFKIRLVKPKGYAVDENGNYHPNIRVTIFNSEGDTVGHADKFMGDDAVFDQFSLKNLTLTLGFRPGTALGHYLIKAVFYDQLSSNTLNLDFNVELMEKVEPKPITQYESSISSYKSYFFKMSNFKAEEALLGAVDFSKYDDKVIVPVSILGINIPKEQFSNVAASEFTLYSSSKVMSIQASSQTRVITNSDGTTQLDILFILPKNEYKKDDIVRFRWDSEDKKYVMDCILKLP